MHRRLVRPSLAAAVGASTWVRRFASTGREQATKAAGGQDPAESKTASTAISVQTETKPSEQVDDPERSKELALFETYGEGSFRFYRALYKDLCDEMRREVHAKPPPPLLFSEVPWKVTHDEANNQLLFERPADEKRGRGRVLVYTEVKMGDPPRMNELLTFTTWYAPEVLIERNGTVLHVSMSQAECNMHMRNVRVYKSFPELFDTSANGHWARTNLLYDGPCLFHLELAVQQELYEVTMDHGVNADFMMWLSQWVYYTEHRAWVRWALSTLQTVLPAERIGNEHELLTEEEQQLLAEPAEQWLATRGQ